MLGLLLEPRTLLSACLTVMATHFVGSLVYNVYFHPLRTYPGPWHRGASRIPYAISIFRGDATQRVKRLHDKYGHVVRITPDTLSYTCSQAWTDIYGLKGRGKSGNLAKDPKFYIIPPGGTHTISSAPDNDHRRLRRLQAHAFSEKALSHHEVYLQHHVHRFVAAIEQESEKHDGQVDFVKWVNYLTTDIIGDLAFGESFGGLENGELHPWLETIFTTLKTFAFIREILRMPDIMIRIALACIPMCMTRHREESLRFGAEAAKRRIAMETDRKDLMSYILRHQQVEGVGMTQDEIEMAAITYIVAGSETTATAMSGAIYLLATHPDVLETLTTSLRSDFATASDMTLARLGQHIYLEAVIKESLRLYPPAPDQLFRTSGNSSGSNNNTDESPVVMVAGQPVPPDTSLTVNIWAANRSRRNFHRPDDFAPDRWLEGEARPECFRGDDTSVLKPFSIGPRDCLGKGIARAEMRLILASFLWHFDLVALEKESQNWIQGQKIYFLWEKTPLQIRIAPRKEVMLGES